MTAPPRQITLCVEVFPKVFAVPASVATLCLTKVIAEVAQIPVGVQPQSVVRGRVSIFKQTQATVDRVILTAEVERVLLESVPKTWITQ